MKTKKMWGLFYTHVTQYPSSIHWTKAAAKEAGKYWDKKVIRRVIVTFQSKTRYDIYKHKIKIL